MDPFNKLNPFEASGVERTHDDALQTQQADQAGFQQHLNEFHPHERQPPSSNRLGQPYLVSNRDAEQLSMPHEDRVGQSTSRSPSDPASEQGGNQNVLFAAADHHGQLPAGSFSLTDCWHVMDAVADWPTHSVDQEEHSWAEADDVVAEWPTSGVIPWEQNLAASNPGRHSRPGDGNTSRGGPWLAPAAAQGALHGTGPSTSGSASNLTDLEDPVLSEARLDEILDTFAGEPGQTENEDRHEAVRRIRAWAEAGDVYARLDLPYLGLTTLPAAFPPGLQSLDVSNNELVHLPDTLPAGLRWLGASDNRLTSLPDTFPAGLQSLEIGSNQLTRLPETLPENLATLAAGSCRLTSLPDTLPAGLQDLDVRGNLLTSLPNALPTGLQTLAVGGNRLTQPTRDPAARPPGARSRRQPADQPTERPPCRTPVALRPRQRPDQPARHPPA
ncbi:hypothetical protein [Bradyrhizobium sp. BR 1432]|uniref:hypothetical protein n=1 Tax=Bradyrhizobium sp. BR 1432 TaxID=3447966 RepID=UPI003EE6888A